MNLKFQKTMEVPMEKLISISMLKDIPTFLMFIIYNNKHRYRAMCYGGHRYG